MNRRDLQELAALRLKEARVLLNAGCWEGAYYLGGYVVEFAIKACIARQTKRYDFPDKKRVNDSHSHDIGNLVRVASLEAAPTQERARDPLFDANWNLMTEWWEQSRYERPSQVDAESLLHAIQQRRHGVLRWIKLSW